MRLFALLQDTVITNEGRLGWIDERGPIAASMDVTQQVVLDLETFV